MRFIKNRLSVSFVLFAAMLASMLAIGSYLALTGGVSNKAESVMSHAVTDIIFYDAATGEPVASTSNLYNIGAEGSIYFVVPRDIPENISLCFKTRHMYFDVRFGDEIIYHTDYDESRLYTASLGTEWITVPLETRYAGKPVYIDYRLAYAKKHYGFSEAALTRPEGYVLDIMGRRLGSSFLCMIYIAIGLMLILLGVVSLKISGRDMSLFWLGAFAISVAFYCTLETQFLQLFVSNSRLVHLLIMFAMALMPIPAVAYVDALLGVRPKWLTAAFSGVQSGTYFILTVFNFFGIADYHDGLLLMQALLLCSIVIMAISMARYIVVNIRRDRRASGYVKAMIVGVLGIMVTGVIDLIRYWSGAGGDPVVSIRYGFLVFLLGFAVASSERVISAFRDSARTEIIAKLAYEDGLTGLRNRTSYQEKRAEAERNGVRTGIVMMDLNNLKYVNDNMGHDDGDAMLLAAAGLIRAAYGDIEGASCYRIGGDEFVALIQNDDIEKSCEDGIARMREAYSRFNAETDTRFKLVIAAGYAVYDPDNNNNNISFADAADRADCIMYEDKRYLKSRRLLNIMI